MSSTSASAQICFPGFEAFKKPAWAPRQCVLEVVKQYFLGYAAHDRQIFARRKHIAGKLGMSVRNLARYLKHLAEAGWIVTTRRKVRTAIRSVLHAVTDVSVPSYVPSSKRTSDETVLLVEQAKQTVQVCSVPALPPKQKQERLPPISIKPPWTVNEFGRQVLDPIWSRIHRILREAQDRIRRARNPKAYEQAIIRGELQTLGIDG